MQEILLRDWSVARREQKRLSVIVFRIDALESYHQLFGRHATEACLRKVAHSIANSLQRAADYCARVGHDRFAVMIGGAEEDRVVAFAERIAQRVRDLAIHHPAVPARPLRDGVLERCLGNPLNDGADEPGLLEDAEAQVSGSDAPRIAIPPGRSQRRRRLTAGSAC